MATEVSSKQTTAAAVAGRAPARAWRLLARAALNPMLVRNARSLLRGRRWPLLQLAYIGGLILTMALVALVIYQSQGPGRYVAPSVDILAEYGRGTFHAIFIVQFVLLLLVVAGYSAASISIEHEKRTYEALAITSLKSSEVVFGHIASMTLLAWMLLLTSLPLAAFCALFGGVSPAQIALCYGSLAMKIPLWGGSVCSSPR